LRRSRLLAADAGLLTLTDAGRALHADLRPRVDGVRSRLAHALPEGDYAELLDALRRLIEGVRGTPSQAG
jgi:DNA-binding MarR family transcriptional regulator